MKTTQQIYTEMRETMAQRSGYAPEDGSELAVRLYAAAAQIESLYAYADWSRRQCFPQTAVGEYLDMHAQMHGLTREPAEPARGTLIIGIDHALDFLLTVPAGTRFCVPGGLQYRLIEDCPFHIGLTENEAAAECVEAGTAGNAPAGAICGLTEAPNYVSSVYNPGPFTGGLEPESDQHLRARVLDACRRCPNGANTDYYEAVALALPGITSAAAIAAYPSAGGVGLCVSGNYGAPQDGQLLAVREALAGRTELGVDLSVIAPTLQAVTVAVTVSTVDGVSGADAEDAARAAIEAHFAKPMLKRGFYRSEAGSAIYNTGLVKNYVFTAPAADLPASATTMYTLGTLQVTEGA